MFPHPHLPAVLDLPHQVHTVGNDNQDDPHVFGKRQEQIAEVFRFNDGAFGIQFVDFVGTENVDDIIEDLDEAFKAVQ